MTSKAATESVPASQLQNGKFLDRKTSVIIEQELHLVLNGNTLATASLMPGLETEFVTGYLFAQGFIETPEDIAALTLEENVAQVTIFRNMEIPRSTSPGCRIVSGGGRIACTDVPLFKIQSTLTLHKKMVFEAMKSLFDIGRVYKQTEGAHAAGIFTKTAQPAFVVEDMGRHNCLDKAIGYALLNGLDRGTHFLVSTGRMTSEMVTKLCRAGFPVAATKTAVTDQGLRIAKSCGITLIGFVRDTGMKIHTDMEVRIIEEPVMKIYSGAERITGISALN